jgi:hypothetical protein
VAAITRTTHGKDRLNDKAVELLERGLVRLGEADGELLRLVGLTPCKGDLSELESSAGGIKHDQLKPMFPFLSRSAFLMLGIASRARNAHRMSHSKPSVAVRFFSPFSFSISASSVADLSGVARKRARIFCGMTRRIGEKGEERGEERGQWTVSVLQRPAGVLRCVQVREDSTELLKAAT